MKNDIYIQGRFRVEFPDEMTKEEIKSIREMVIKLLERHSCKVIKIEE